MVPWVGRSKGVNCRAISIGPKTLTSNKSLTTAISVSSAGDSSPVSSQQLWIAIIGPTRLGDASAYTFHCEKLVSAICMACATVHCCSRLGSSRIVYQDVQFPPVSFSISFLTAVIESGLVTSNSRVSIPLAARSFIFAKFRAVAKTRIPVDGQLSELDSHPWKEDCYLWSETQGLEHDRYLLGSTWLTFSPLLI